MIEVFYSPEYAGAAFAFETTRKSRWIADSLAESPIAGLRLVAPAALRIEDLIRVHDPAYVRAVRDGVPRALAESQGFTWDEGLWRMVCASSGGAVAAARSAMAHGVAGSLSSGLHHARRDRGAAFCTFNGLVLAAQAALDDGATSVLVLDLDAHCGGGTASLVEADPRIHQVDVSVSSVDRYRAGPRMRWEMVGRAESYLPTVERALRELDSHGHAFDLCLYNAGMDPFERCATGGLPGITRELLAMREQLVFEWCRARNTPVAFVLAGGYLGAGLDEAGIVDLHRLTLASAAAIT
jgi:acetoin utilization deacetylase AcuC-like enzyme